MIKVINLLRNTSQIVKCLQCHFHRKPRHPSVPTQQPTLEPFSINHLHNNPGSTYTPKRLGRGPGSGKGKTSGRGHKGHWSRSGGGPHVRFEGGQSPLQKILPKYGIVHKKRPRQFLNSVNLQTIDYYVKLNVLNPNQKITMKTLVDVGIVKKPQFGVKILARGADRITYPLHFEVSDASKEAIRYLTKQGGSVKLLFLTPLKLKELIYPHKFPIALLDPLTPFWRIKKLERIQKDRGIPISYPKPKWLVDDMRKESMGDSIKIEKDPFIYPIPIVQNSGKIRKRKVPVYRKINYNLP